MPRSASLKRGRVGKGGLRLASFSKTPGAVIRREFPPLSKQHSESGLMQVLETLTFSLVKEKVISVLLSPSKFTLLSCRSLIFFNAVVIILTQVLSLPMGIFT